MIRTFLSLDFEALHMVRWTLGSASADFLAVTLTLPPSTSTYNDIMTSTSQRSPLIQRNFTWSCFEFCCIWPWTLEYYPGQESPQCPPSSHQSRLHARDSELCPCSDSRWPVVPHSVNTLYQGHRTLTLPWQLVLFLHRDQTPSYCNDIHIKEIWWKFKTLRILEVVIMWSSYCIFHLLMDKNFMNYV